MKNLVFIYCGFEESHAFDKIFSGISAFERVLLWAKEISEKISVRILLNPKFLNSVKASLSAQNFGDYKIIEKSTWNTQNLLETMAAECAALGADCAVFAMGDKPFLDIELTSAVLSEHKKYLAEYTFADGYPEGFAPKSISSGTLNILSQLAKSKNEFEKTEVTENCLFEVLKTDINSFEIESVISPEDFRMFRFDFSCSSKQKTLACKNLYELALENHIPFKVLELTKFACTSSKIQQTVPYYYNIQICAKRSSKALYNPNFPLEETEIKKFMSLEHFKALLKEISDLSEEAVISLSAFGDAFENPEILLFIEEVLKNPHFNLVLETEGIALDANKISKIRELLNKFPELKKSPSSIKELKNKINFIVYLDAFTSEKYFEIHKNCPSDSFEKAKNNAALLEENFPGCVFVQFTRMKENECELEKFYRFYTAKESFVKGRVIIQKYDDFCGLLPNKKCADLSPLERNVCWHLKRELTILKNGDVPLCREAFSRKILGNVFAEGLEKIWLKSNEFVQNQIEKKYLKICEDCDEYYTFNF